MKKEATETTEGYTGDIYCKDCNTLLEKRKDYSEVRGDSR